MSKREVLKNLLLRPPVGNLNQLHKNAKKLRDQMTQAPEPLKYKLNDIDPQLDGMYKPLGVSQTIPFHSWNEADWLHCKNSFKIGRSHMGNLPVYREYRNGRHSQKTIIRHISGDVEEFAKELSKVVSNSDINVKVGRVEIKGLHKEAVTYWLRRLGF